MSAETKEKQEGAKRQAETEKVTGTVIRFNRNYPAALEAITGLINAANPGQTITVERRHIDRDGEYFSVAVTPYTTGTQAKPITAYMERDASEVSKGEEGLTEGVRELDRIAMAAWRAREALHLNLVKLGEGLDPATAKSLVDLINDLNEHMPLSEDGHVWRMRTAISSLLDDPAQTNRGEDQ